MAVFLMSICYSPVVAFPALFVRHVKDHVTKTRTKHALSETTTRFPRYN